jgi:hypothetical protein
VQNEFTILEEVREAILFDLGSIGHRLLKVRELAAQSGNDHLMPDWKRQRFIFGLVTAGEEILKAMDCLDDKASPTTISLVHQIIARWQFLQPAEEREEIVKLLRAAFTKKTKEGK